MTPEQELSIEIGEASSPAAPLPRAHAPAASSFVTSPLVRLRVVRNRQGITVASLRAQADSIATILAGLFARGLAPVSPFLVTEASPVETRARSAAGGAGDGDRPEPEAAVLQFLAEACESAHCYWMPARELNAVYRQWCAARQLVPVSLRVFGAVLRSGKFRRGRSRRLNGRQIRSWEGLRLRSGPA
jgi:hypothetical protein